MATVQIDSAAGRFRHNIRPYLTVSSALKLRHSVNRAEPTVLRTLILQHQTNLP